MRLVLAVGIALAWVPACDCNGSGSGDGPKPGPACAPMLGDMAPDPASVAPPLDPTVVTDVAAAARFLYEGTPPIQAGVAPGAIDPTRAAVLRGTVRARGGGPLGGVKLRVLGHAELGTTTTRADGGYDLAVVGGAPLTVIFEGNCYATLQRQVDIAPLTYVTVPEVALTPLDGSYLVELGKGSFQSVQASTSTDKNGSRKATIIFPPGVQASMNMGGGNMQPLADQLTVRATELTVGDDGPAAMPGALPATSAYTYAVELTSDEVMSAGAMGLQFDQPVSVYVDNFLGFPVGGNVPVGFYDRERGVWEASQNGRIVKVLAVHGGSVDLDVDGSGHAADGSALAMLGITSGERAELAKLFAAGASLWRFQTTHFSVADCNWGQQQLRLKPFRDPKWGKPEKDPCKKKHASTIECQNQALEEDLPIAGTPYVLHYSSGRAPGSPTGYTVTVPILSDVVPDNLTGIDAELTVAGQHLAKHFTPAQAQDWTVTWNGLDGYGRRAQGAQAAEIRVTYHLASTYGDTPGFGQPPTSMLSMPTREDQPITLVYQATLGAWFEPPAEGLGGWSIDVHHVYEPGTGTVYLGDGRQTGVTALGGVLRHVAGTGDTGYDGDGGPAETATLWFPEGIVVAPDGSVVFADSTNNRIRRIDRKTGIITTIAGGDDIGFGGDGGPAATALLDGPTSLAYGPDGALYFSDAGNQRIRRIRTNGVIETVGGNGESDTTGDGGPAIDASLDNPGLIAIARDGTLYVVTGAILRRITTDGRIATVTSMGEPVSGWLSGLAVGPDGTVYFSDASVIQMITPDGAVSVFAGTGFNGPLNDGGPATSASLNSVGALAVGPDGTVYLHDFGHNRIRRIEPSGIIRTIAGTTDFGWGPTGGLAANTTVGNVYGLAVAADGTLYIADGETDIRAIRPARATTQGGDLVAPSPSGDAIYLFDAQGRHERTVDALTGAVRASFGYDAAGRLIRVTDRGGNVTQIERDAAGVATAIVAPGGQTTVLAHDATNRLVELIDPAGAHTTMTYNSGGLLTSLTDGEGHASTYTWVNGRLVLDADADMGSIALARVDDALSSTVTMTTALGRKSTFETMVDPDLGTSYANVDPAGLTSTVDLAADGSADRTDPIGTHELASGGIDPLFGAYVPYASQYTLELPSGLTLARSESRAVQVDPNNASKLVSRTHTVDVNGKAVTYKYSAVNRSFDVLTASSRMMSSQYDTQGRIGTLAVSGASAVTVSYDAQGRPLTYTHATRTFTNDYDAAGNLVAVTDPLSRTTQFGYDAAGRVTSRTLPDGRVIAYRYDRAGNLVGVTPPGRSEYRFTYTAKNQLASVLPPAIAGVPTPVSLSYDKDHALTSVLRADGRTITIAHDTAGRESSIALERGNITIGYDTTHGTVRTLVSPDNVTMTITRDGPLTPLIAWTGAITGNVQQAFDKNLRPTSERINSGAPQLITYDADGLISAVGGVAVTRDGAGRATQITLGGVTETFSYYPSGDLKSHTAKYQGTTIFSEAYTRDGLGRIIAATEQTSSATHTLAYDRDLAGRLISATRDGVTVTYEYDENDNRITADGVAATFDEQDRLVTSGTSQYTYLADGELASRHDTTNNQTTAYAYDELGNLLSVTRPGVVVSYLLDGDNQRVGRKINGALGERWFYASDGRLVGAIDPGTSVVSQFLWATRENVPDAMIQAQNTYKIIADARGSVRLVVNTANGFVQQAIDYDPWGVVIADSGAGFQPFGFAGGLYDPATGLVHFAFRDYDPALGRFTSQDPAGFASTTNLYEYVAQDPVDFIDPLGLWNVRFNAYDGIGGEVVVGSTAQGGATVCLGGGVGVGAGLTYSPEGNGWEPGWNGFADASYGPFNASLRVDPCNPLRWSVAAGPQLPFAPIRLRARVSGDLDGVRSADAQANYRIGWKQPFEPSGPSLSARIGFAHCWAL